MDNDKTSTSNLIFIGIVVVVLVAGGWWLLTRDSAVDDATGGNVAEDTNMDAADVSTETIAPPSTTTSDGETISVASQSAGNSVTISSVTLTEMGWIAVRDDRGWTLGAARLDAGTHENIVVELLRATESGQRYQVLLYHDDGDREFDLKKESLITHSDGTVAGVMFKVQ
ncbi:MAG: hypothetical protein UY61_C0055G0003 [Candidatus Adlerbacteria bacterium GW2011_GWC1_50_9]|uniref:DUF7282 domain-containing protein n=2 Tax=Parcubacteria group TaxID=1794811 RepID=A0A0G1ZJH8_9BACT|nr:MAG: hypothetical protein UY61_C0055G0003 [Candidatus Adlerbacteria bacterium GW2011_GWC1_50_9]KKW30092.1 MAG: hypothetical protein UY74_C0052G0004 [Candidatus Kaiserbacteria bacterium GW2011_GWC2_52_8b]